ncbi:MAG: ABC transporter permease [Rhodobacteraceae bacterium]|nr:ABC transporter permease [Paracoccaceae bacterium]MCY4250051.1 ABC transporter permease [Paracoccaceae bacterium]
MVNVDSLVGRNSLHRKVQRSLRIQKLRALGLIAPLFIFILISFVIPIGDMLFRSIENQLVSEVLPRTTEYLKSEQINEGWEPPDELFWHLYIDLAIATEVKLHTRVGSRLNYEKTGISSLFRKTGRSIKKFGADDYSKALSEQMPELASIDYWELLSQGTSEKYGYTRDTYNTWKKNLIANDHWSEKTKPSDFLFVVLANDIKSQEIDSSLDASREEKLLPVISELPEIGFKERFLNTDEDWAEPDVWDTIQLYSPSFTNGYYLNSVDFKKGSDGPKIRPENERLYVLIFSRTLFMSVTITLVCLLLGYPVAYFLANLPLKYANLFLILVLLPFWTSLLVRTSAWKVLLQNEGVINDILVATGLISNLERLELINNQTGTIIAMSHILLPFMILPLFSVMKTIHPSYVRAAKSLGATPWTAFRRVYFPQSIPGIGAGSILVFILSIGYYITPELVGGTTGTFISNRIAYHISSSLNWGLGAALGSILLAVVLALYWVYDRMVGIDNVKLG